jgi:hypothetical protein
VYNNLADWQQVMMVSLIPWVLNRAIEWPQGEWYFTILETLLKVVPWNIERRREIRRWLLVAFLRHTTWKRLNFNEDRVPYFGQMELPKHLDKDDKITIQLVPQLCFARSRMLLRNLQFALLSARCTNFVLINPIHESMVVGNVVTNDFEWCSKDWMVTRLLSHDAMRSIEIRDSRLHLPWMSMFGFDKPPVFPHKLGSCLHRVCLCNCTIGTNETIGEPVEAFKECCKLQMLHVRNVKYHAPLLLCCCFLPDLVDVEVRCASSSTLGGDMPIIVVQHKPNTTHDDIKYDTDDSVRVESPSVLELPLSDDHNTRIFLQSHAHLSGGA